MDPGSLIIFALPLLLLVWIFTRTRRQQREVADVQGAIEPGRRVMMTSGVYGDIVSVGGTSVDGVAQGPDTVVVELAPGVRTTWARQAVARVLPEAVPPGTMDDDVDDDMNDDVNDNVSDKEPGGPAGP